MSSSEGSDYEQDLGPSTIKSPVNVVPEFVRKLYMYVLASWGLFYCSEYIPMFLFASCLYYNIFYVNRILEDKNYINIVRWSTGGNSFLIVEPNEFAKIVLSHHFKHSNISSFVRQLNKYDFHKIKNPDDNGKQVSLNRFL